MVRNVKVVKDEKNPETAEVLAKAIITIAEGFEKLLSADLQEWAIVALLRHMPGMNLISQREIRLVLQNLKRLKGYYVKKKS